MRCTFFWNATVAIVGLLLTALSAPAIAGVEFVTVVKILSNDDHGIIVRSNGDAYQIEKGVGCLSFWRYEGKQVLVSSPGIFLGVGSSLILPDENQTCRIWDFKELGPWSGAESDQHSQPSQPSKQGPPKMRSGKCTDGHWISSVSRDGQIIVLEDRSVWEIDVVDAIDAMLWLPADNVVICGNRMINSGSGEAVTATRIK